MRSFEVETLWDAEASVWCGRAAEIPVSTEADTVPGLVSRMMEIVPEVLELNGLAEHGESVELRFRDPNISPVIVTAP